jgi:hypothetical protein
MDPCHVERSCCSKLGNVFCHKLPTDPIELLLLLLFSFLLLPLLLRVHQLINSLSDLPHSDFAVDSQSPHCQSRSATVEEVPWLRRVTAGPSPVKALARSHESSCVIFGGHSSNETDSSTSTSSFPSVSSHQSSTPIFHPCTSDMVDRVAQSV